MNHPIKIIANVLMLPAFIFCLSQTTAAQKWIKLSKKGYTIQLPADWSIDSSKQMGTDLILFSMLENTTDPFRENVNVMIQNLEGMNIDLDKFSHISEGQIKKMAADAKIEKSEKITATIPFQKIIYSATQNGLKLTFEQYYYVAGKRAYIITLTTETARFSMYKTTGEQILNSFMLSK